MLKLNENPPIIWPETKSIREFEGMWLVAHTKSRNEKALAWDILHKQIGYFLPMSWKVTHRKGRTFKSLLPLFAGYLFFCGNEKQRIEVLQTNRVANLLEVKDQKRLISELSQIELAIKAGVRLEPYKYIEAGQLCRVTAGPLAGLEGIVVQRRGDARLVLQIDMLGQASSLEIEIDMIEVVK